MFFVSMALVVLAFVAIAVFGLRLGVDFKGGSLMEIKFVNSSRPDPARIQEILSQEKDLGEVSVSPASSDSFILRLREVNEPTHQKVLTDLKTQFPNIEESRFDAVGGIIGQELKRKSMGAIIFGLILISIYIGFVFRKISGTIPSLSMSLAAIIALIHDVTIPIGVFAILGHFYGMEITAVFLAAILTILGYSISDTVVVFDRIRENVIRHGLKENFGELVHQSVMQTLVRSINTNITTLLSLLAIFFFGGETLKYFSLALIVGIFLGAYSSIFVASPILVWWSKRRA